MVFPLTAVCICQDGEGTILVNFSATKGRVFKQRATKFKSRVFKTKSYLLIMCAREGMIFVLVVPGRVQNVKKLH